jgi:hypothetical protein
MALDNPTPVHFDRYDGTTVVDPDGSVHFPVILQGSTINFRFRLIDKATGLAIDNTNYTVAAQFRDRKGGRLMAPATVTKLDSVTFDVRVSSTDSAAIKAQTGVFEMEYTVDDGGALDDHVHRFADGRYYMTPEALVGST